MISAAKVMIWFAIFWGIGRGVPPRERRADLDRAQAGRAGPDAFRVGGDPEAEQAEDRSWLDPAAHPRRRTQGNHGSGHRLPEGRGVRDLARFKARL
jgi:hypothetical protein